MARKKVFIKVYVKAGEKAAIAEAARACRLSASAYARTLALGDPPTPCAYLDRLDDVMKLHADLGRLGGLLKMTLTNDERLNDMGREMGVATIDATLVDIRATQAKLLELVDMVAMKTKSGR
jgi:hypothetical protein